MLLNFFIQSDQKVQKCSTIKIVFKIVLRKGLSAVWSALLRIPNQHLQGYPPRPTVPSLDFWYALLLSCSSTAIITRQHVFTVVLQNDASESLRQFTKLEDTSPLVTVIDFPLNRFSVMEYGAEITEHSVKAFVSDFFTEKHTFKPISDKT